MTARHLIPATLLAATLAGCSHNNDRVTLGGRTEAETVSLDSISGSVSMEAAAGASAPTLDRSGWEQVTIVSPPEHVDHCPHLTQLSPQYSSDRRHGNHPTADSALTLDGNHMAYAETPSAVGWAGWDIILMLPRSVIDSLRQPAEHYERASASDRPATSTP